MNKDNAHLYLPLVQALADGRVIQSVDSDGEWFDMSDPQFCSKPDRYRIKPEPREWWVVDREGVPAMFTRWFDSENAAAEFIYSHGGKLIHVREVTQ